MAGTATEIRIDGTPTNGSNPWIDGLVWGGRWVDTLGLPTTGGPITITFALMSGSDPYGYLTGTGMPWSSPELEALLRAMTAWEAVANIDFVYTTDPNAADVWIWKERDNGSLGQSEMPSYSTGEPLYVRFNGEDPSWTSSGLAVGGYAYVTLLHELGHLLGLAHPHDGGSASDGNVFPGVSSAFGDFGDYNLNQGIFTTMSYNDGWASQFPGHFNNNYGWQASPMALDVAAIQLIYGKNTTYASGNNVYYIHTSNINGTYWSCLWDTGGIDTISNFNSTVSCLINLNDASLEGPNAGGYVSYAFNIVGGFTIANGVVIENAIGGKSNDTLIGNSANNNLDGGDGSDRLTGGKGNDTLNGGSGTDYAYFNDNQSECTITFSSGNFIVGSKTEGTDTLTNIEYVVFNGVAVAVSSLISDTTGPTFTSATTSADGLKVILTYNEPLSATTAAKTAFAVKVAGVAATVSSVAVNGSTIELTLATSIGAGQAVTVGYTAPTKNAATTNAAVQDTGGNDAATLVATTTVTNISTADKTGPAFTSATTSADGLKVILTYNEPLSATTAAKTAFAVKVAGVAATVSSVAVNGSTVELTLATSIGAGQAVTVGYTAPTKNAATTNAAVQDSGGNDAVTLVATTAVTNISTADKTGPTFTSATTSADGLKVILTYNEPLSATTAAKTAFAVKVAGVAATVSSVAVNGSTIELTLATSIGAGQAVTVGYTAPTKNAATTNAAVQDTGGNDAATLVATTTVTNISTADKTAPVVSTFTPTDGLTGITLGSNIVLTFSEAITRGTGNITLRSGSATGAVVESFDAATSNRLTVSGSTLIIDPTNNLSANTQYFVVFTSSNIKDIAGNAYAGISTYDFRTGNIINGTANNDTLTGTANADTINGLVGNDTITGGAGKDSMDGGEGSDLYIVAASADHAAAEFADTGASGTDEVRFTSTTANSTLTLYAGDTGIEKVAIGTGTAAAAVTTTTTALNINASLVLNALSIYGNAGANVITGTGFADYILGYAGNDTLNGGDGGDTIDGGAGTNILNGGAGFDFVDYRDRTTAVTVSLAITTAQTTGGGGTDTLSGFEGILGGSANDIITGDSNDNIIDGYNGDDTLNGRDGDDIIRGGAGNDILTGGTGFDFVDYRDRTTAVTVSLAITTAQATGGGGTDTLSGFEGIVGSSANDVLIGDGNANAIYGYSGNDGLYGDAGNDYLYGGLGNDYLVGGLGDDTIDGGDGDDTISGGAGNNILIGGTGFDFVDYRDSIIAVTVSLAITTAQTTGGSGSDTLFGFEGIAGGSANDVLTGDGNGNAIYGFNGNDHIFGGGGDDYLFGGFGDDIINGSDNINGGDWANGGAGSDILYGQAGDDTLFGEAGDDVISGGEGYDDIIGGDGNDNLTGGSGIDWFYFDTTPNATTNKDTVTDFTSGTDKLIFIKTAFTGLSDADSGMLSSDAFRSGAGITTASDADDRFIYDTTAGYLYYDADGNASASEAVLVAMLRETTPLAYTDISIISTSDEADKGVFSKTLLKGLSDADTDNLSSDAFWSGARVTTAHDAGNRFIYDTTAGYLYYDADGNASASEAVLVAMLGSTAQLTFTDLQIIG